MAVDRLPVHRPGPPERVFAARDEHLRSADFFDAAHHPQATFSGHAADWQGSRGRLAGELTLGGITRPVTLQAEYLGYAADP